MASTNRTAWEAKNPDYQEVVRGSFARQSMMTTLGARIEHIAPGEIDLLAPFTPQLGQQNGFWHAGAVASLADSANGYASFTLAPPSFDVLAVEFKINLLAPAKGDAFLGQGRVLRPGRRLTVCLCGRIRLRERTENSYRDDALHRHHAPAGVASKELA